MSVSLDCTVQKPVLSLPNLGFVTAQMQFITAQVGSVTPIFQALPPLRPLNTLGGSQENYSCLEDLLCTCFASSDIPVVPQDLLFLIYIDNVSFSEGSTLNLFADDMLLIPRRSQQLQSDINKVHEWVSSKHLTLNPIKCRFMFNSRKWNPIQTPHASTLTINANLSYLSKLRTLDTL